MRSSARDPHSPRTTNDHERRASHLERNHWSQGRRENLLIGYILSLSLLLAVAHLPPDFGDHAAYLRSASTVGVFDDETLPVITVQDVGRLATAVHPFTRERTLADLPPAELDLEELEESGTGRAESWRPEAIQPSDIQVSAAVRTFAGASQLRYISGPPQVDDAPRLRVGSMIIRYPLSALRKAIEGLVIVRFTVEPDGRASGVEVLHPLDPACDAEVIQAVRDARFLPGKRAGRPVPAYSQMTVRFVLAD